MALLSFFSEPFIAGVFWMKITVCLIALFVLAATAQKPTTESPLHSMVATERAFSQASADKGTRDSFLMFIAEDGILFRPSAVLGKKWLLEHPVPLVENRPLLSWQPTFAYMAAAGDMGYTFGPWEYKRNINDQKPSAFGHFITMWKKQADGAWRFAIHVNLTSSLTAAWGPIARLIIGGLVGPAGAAIYRVAASLADSAQKPADLLGKVYYPEVVRMDLATKKPWRLMLRGTALAGAVALAFILTLLIIGRPLIDLLFGKEFLAAYPVIMVLLIAPLLGVVSFPLPSMLYALDRADAPLKARLLGTIIFLTIIAPLAWSMGVIGAAVAFVTGTAATVAKCTDAPRIGFACRLERDA
jgi:ketosteroid isomerase-like protein